MALMLQGSVVVASRRGGGGLVRCSVASNGAASVADVSVADLKGGANAGQTIPISTGPLTFTTPVEKPPAPQPIRTFGRSKFPPGFIFGTASSAYQIEGAANEGGRGPSIWDTFSHIPGKINDGTNGDNGIQSYYKYKDDVNLMKDMGLDAYRFSISWSRILPKGTIAGGVNKEGIEYYHNLIKEITDNGMIPCVTLFHWDLPQVLEDAYGGFLNEKIVNDFRDYADLCFREYGNEVKFWTTLNEPWSFSNVGYNMGGFAPGRCSPWVGNCIAGDSGTEPYIVTHNLLLAHAAAVKQYNDKYKAFQNGQIGITLNCHWHKPLDENNIHDKHAAERAVDFMFGWYMDPITKGEYPFSMRRNVKNRLPEFRRDQRSMLEGSYDFIGVNYYTTQYAKDHPSAANKLATSYTNDQHLIATPKKDGVLIGPQAGSSWLHVYPDGIKDLLLHTMEKYNHPIIYITENGMDQANKVNDQVLPLEEALKDDMRVQYYNDHLQKVLEAIRMGVDVKGYYAWSIFDNFEWNEGFNLRFGLHYVDYDNYKRYPKKSVGWFKQFLSQ